MNECLEDGVGLQGHCFPRVNLLQGEYPRLYEKSDGIANDLVWLVGVICNCLDLLTLLNLVEEHFWGFGDWEGSLEQHVIVEQQHCIRLAVKSLSCLRIK